MSGTVDSRIVSMKFDNGDFGSKITKTLELLEKLRHSVSFPNAGKGLEQLQAKTNSFNLNGMNNAIEGVSKKFLALSTVGITALATITTRALQAGASIVKGFTFKPITDGLHEYETNLNSVQTILANTQASGATLTDVNKALQELNTYSDKTIYNFSEMARNIGTFTAAGVDLQTSTNAIKGLSNLAALSGSNAEQASGAMYQLSQELAAGRVSLLGWNSVVTAGMGGTVFQRALTETAVRMGKLDAGAVKLTGKMKNVTIAGTAFRDSLSHGKNAGWLTSDVLTKTLNHFTGDLTDAQLKAEGYSASAIKAIQAQAKTAMEAATNVKTFSQVIDVAKETAGSGWAQTWQLIFGDFDQAKGAFTGLSNMINGLINASAKSRNALLGDWNKLGGRTMLIQALKDAWKALVSVVGPIKRAFRDVFPKRTGKDLYDLTVRLDNFFKRMTLGRDAMNKLRATFQGVAAVFDIVKQVIHGVVGLFGRLFGAVGKSSEGFLGATANIGHFLVVLDNSLKSGQGITKFFDKLGSVIAVPAQMISRLAHAIGDFFDGFGTGKMAEVTDGFDRLSGVMKPVSSLGDGVHRVLQRIGHAFGQLGDLIGGALVKVSNAIAKNFSLDTFKGMLAAVNTGLLAALVLSIKKFLGGGVKVDVGGGLFSKIKTTLDGVNQSLAAMQQNLKANILLKIAGAIALLAASIYVISTINSQDLARSLVTITVGFIAMQMALVSMSKAIGIMGTAKLPLITSSLMLLAGAMVVMAGALKILASINPEDTGRSLVALAAMLVISTTAMKALGAGSAGMIRGATALVILSGALTLMAGALKLLSLLSWDDMAHGMAAMAGGLVIMAAALKIMPRGIIQQAIAIGVLAGAMNLMAGALKLMSMLSWKQMGRGMVGIAGSLGLIALAMYAMPPDMVLQAAALVLVAGALNEIAVAMKIMGTMSGDAIAKSLIVLAGGLLILAAGLTVMSGTLAGAAALVVAAAALAVLVPVLIALGAMSWTMIIKSMVALAGTFLILGLAATLMAPLVPVLLGLGAALILVGAGFALAGAGAFLFATAFGIVVAAGSAGVTVLTGILGALIAAIPKFITAVGLGMLQLIGEIVAAAPKIFAALETMLIGFLDTIIAVIPRLQLVFVALITAGLTVLANTAPKFIATGFKILMAFLTGIKNHISAIVGTVSDIVIRFVTEMGKKAGPIADAGFKALINFLDGISAAIDANSERLGEAGARMAKAMAKGLAKGMLGFISSFNPFAGTDPFKDYVDKARVAAQQANAALATPSAPAPTPRTTTTAPKPVAAPTRGRGGTFGAGLHRVASILGSIDTAPVITPVLDLTKFNADAASMMNNVSTPQIVGAVSLDQAVTIAGDQATQTPVDVPVQPAPTVVNLEQNNYSPQSLSTTEIYRQTNNQLSLAKKLLIPA